MSTPVRVLLVDDHTLFRSGVRALLARQTGIEVVGEADSGAEGVKLATIVQPDVVLLDLNMPGLSGVETLQLLLQDTPQRAVVMLTVSKDADDLAMALRAGAGYLLKNVDAFLVTAIQRAAAGESVMSEAMTTKLMQQFRAGAATPLPSDEARLTPRERDFGPALRGGKATKRLHGGWTRRKHGQNPCAEHSKSWACLAVCKPPCMPSSMV